MQADKMFSKVTVTSGRTLLSLSAIVIASHLFGFELTKLPFLQEGLSEAVLLKMAGGFIAFLIIAHLFNWLNDHNGHVFDRFKELADRYEIRVGPKPHPSHTSFDETVAHHVRDIIGKGGAIEDDQLEHIDDLQENMVKLNSWLATIRWFSNWHECLTFFGQHLALPIGAGLWALLVILFAK